MSFWALLFIALGASADAFAVALGKGLHMRQFSVRGAAVIAVTFGLFQAAMPLAGWLLGTAFASYIADFDHWIAFGLLALIGAKMLWEAFTKGADDDEDVDRISTRELLLLAVATSIDALAVGVTTTVLTFAGVLVGHRVGARFGKPAEIAGGVVLIVIGTSILLEHLGVLA